MARIRVFVIVVCSCFLSFSSSCVAAVVSLIIQPKSLIVVMSSLWRIIFYSSCAQTDIIPFHVRFSRSLSSIHSQRDVCVLILKRKIGIFCTASYLVEFQISVSLVAISLLVLFFRFSCYVFCKALLYASECVLNKYGQKQLNWSIKVNHALPYNGDLSRSLPFSSAIACRNVVSLNDNDIGEMTENSYYYYYYDFDYYYYCYY